MRYLHSEGVIHGGWMAARAPARPTRKPPLPWHRPAVAAGAHRLATACCHRSDCIPRRCAAAAPFPGQTLTELPVKGSPVSRCAGDLTPGNVLLTGARHTQRRDPRSFQAKVRTEARSASFPTLPPSVHCRCRESHGVCMPRPPLLSQPTCCSSTGRGLWACQRGWQRARGQRHPGHDEVRQAGRLVCASLGFFGWAAH